VSGCERFAGTPPVVVCGNAPEYAASQNRRQYAAKGIRIRGNTRTVKWQYAAKELASVRVLPGIAGYCRVMGPKEIQKVKFKMKNEKTGSLILNEMAGRLPKMGHVSCCLFTL
jgi:hypothetical protein